jgi:hypothetical protein
MCQKPSHPLTAKYKKTKSVETLETFFRTNQQKIIIMTNKKDTEKTETNNSFHLNYQKRYVM